MLQQNATDISFLEIINLWHIQHKRCFIFESCNGVFYIIVFCYLKDLNTSFNTDDGYILLYILN